MPIPPIEYWKPNVQAIIRGDTLPDDLAEWDEESRCYYFPNDSKQYDWIDLDRIGCLWADLHPERD